MSEPGPALPSPVQDMSLQGHGTQAHVTPHEALAPGRGSLWHPECGGTTLKHSCAEQAVDAKNNWDQRSQEEPGPSTVLAAWEPLGP